MYDTHTSFWKRQNVIMALPDSKFQIHFSEHNAYCCSGLGKIETVGRGGNRMLDSVT